jgi:hypothetical protein
MFTRKNHPVTSSKQIGNVIDLEYFGVERDFPEQLSALLHKKKEKPRRVIPIRKRVQQNSFKK